MRFVYTASDAQGSRSQGHVEADNSGAATARLASQGLTLLNLAVEPEAMSAEAATQPPAGAPLRGKRKPKALDVMLFSQQMASMLRAGVPILRALAAAEGGDDNPMGPVASAIRLDLQAGKPLSAAMAAHPKCFDEYYLAMIKVGEATGATDLIFTKLHGHMHFQKQMREQMTAALRYPAIVVGVVFIALMVVNFFVIPAFAKVYSGFKAELPFFTKLLLFTSQFLLDYWWVALGGGAVAVIGFLRWSRTTRGRVSWDRFKLRIPVAGSIAHRATLARFAQSLSLAISSGLPLAGAMSMVGDTTDNAWLAQQISTIKTQLERGDSLYRSCVASNIFTPITLQMILVGEEAGSLDSMLTEVAQLYRDQVEYDLKTITSQLEPFLLFFLGGLVLILALGIFLPIWNLSSAAFPGAAK